MELQRSAQQQSSSAPADSRFFAFRLPLDAGEFVGGAGAHELAPLGIINIFIGPNNAGKSRLLRSLARDACVPYRETAFDIRGFVAELSAAANSIGQILAEQDLVNIGGLRPDTFQKYLATEWDTEPDPFAPGQLTELLAQYSVVPSTPPREIAFRHSRPGDLTLMAVLNSIAKIVTPLAGRLSNRASDLRKIPKVYLPILRGLRPLDQDQDHYALRTTKDYEIPVGSTTTTVFTGLKFYSNLLDLLLGEPTDRTTVREYEQFLSEQLFDGSAIQLTPRRREDVVYVRIDNTERAIHQLGDGIQQLILLTFLPFVTKQRSLFFFEEPDMCLHPGMQRKLVELFASEPRLSRHQYFLTTHSNHIVDMAADYVGVSTFLVRRSGGVSTVTAIDGPRRQVLSELGARASSVFLTNATIWVEGVSDRLYLREYLRRYASLDEGESFRRFREDTHYSFMEGGGSNLAHLDFSDDADDGVEALAEAIKVARVCSSSFVVVDGDCESKPRFKALKESLSGQALYVLKGKEVEHLLPLEVLRAYVASRLPEADTEKLDASYQESLEPLGEILDRVFDVSVFKDGKSIKGKDRLRHFALDYLRTRSDWSLTDDARRLCTALAGWIESEASATRRGAHVAGGASGPAST